MSGDRPPMSPRPTGGPGATRFAARGGHRLSYESIGATDGLPILALHDLLADRGQLRPLADALPRDRFRLTLPDARGHGASPMISGRVYPVAELAADAIAVLDAEGLSQAHVAAVGWGAEIGAGLVLAAPRRVASLTIVEPFIPALMSDEHTLAVLRQAADAAEKGQTDRALDLYVGMRQGAEWRDTTPKARLGAMRRAAGSLAPLLAGMEHSDLATAGASQPHPPVTLLVRHGASDFGSQPVAALTRVFPAARIATWEGGSAEASPDQSPLPALAHAIVALSNR